ncbi:hypothetical protein L226DRAFT_73401 [Lentinus tigrinus ALCF2SS1-7]|nr:hypothetical protein L226DRAFT_73401 [Lentinus tigrinus ALCF2SS1-7]
MQALVDTLDLDVSWCSPLRKQERHSFNNSPNATGSFCGGSWNPGDIVSKNDYLLTPIRQKLFPKASPSVLKTLLSTPSLRMSTPDFSGQFTDTLLSSDSSREAGGTMFTTQNAFVPLELVSPLSLQSAAEVTPFQPSDPIPYLTSHSLPPSPPQSTELPSAAFPSRPGFEAESSPSTQAPGTRLATTSPDPDAEPRRSSHARPHHDPFPDVISSSLRASPCSPLVTRTAAGEGMPSESSPYLRPGLCRPSDPRLLMHNHLASGVVRNFQRVLDELQGLRSRNVDTECTESAKGVVGLLPPLSPPREPAPSPDLRLQNQALARSQAAGSFVATSLRLLPSLGPDMKDDSAQAKDKQLTIGDFSPWERRLDLADCDSPRSATGSRSGHGASSLHPTSSFNGLQEEFVTLLSDQASEEEEHARRLREMAEDLEELARCRRQLAEVVAKKRL